MMCKYMPINGVLSVISNINATDCFWGSEFVGFTHFKRFFSSYYFWRLIKNTLLLSLYQLLLFPLPIILALSLNELRNGPFKIGSASCRERVYFFVVVVWLTNEGVDH